MKKGQFAVIFLLLAAFFAGGCTIQNTDFSLKLIPPQNALPPLEGTWEIVSLLQADTATARELAQKWVGQNLYFAGERVLLGEYFLPNPRYQVKRVVAETYLFYRHQVFPADLCFENQEIEVFTLSDNHLFFCELLQEDDDRLLLNLFNNSYLARKISDVVDINVFASLEIAGNSGTGFPGEPANNQTGVLLGLRAPCPDQVDNTGEQYRTLWLAWSDQKLAPALEAGAIMFPRKNGFYQLQVVRKQEGEKAEDFLTATHLLKQQQEKVGKEEEKEKTEEENVRKLTLNASLPPLNLPGTEGWIARKICFVSNDYVSVEETVKEAPVRGSHTSEESRLRFFPVDGLPGMKAVKISDLAGPEAAATMKYGEQRVRQQLGLNQTSQWDEKNFGLTRKMGYWVFNGRLNYREKDACEKADYDITVIPPDDVVCYNKLQIPWTRVKNHVPSAVDVFTSPAKDLALVITDNEIVVYGMQQENLVNPPLEKIPLRIGEEVIMAEWALGHYVEDWTLIFQTYLTEGN